jgi:hypothetical protein
MPSRVRPRSADARPADVEPRGQDRRGPRLRVGMVRRTRSLVDAHLAHSDHQAPLGPPPRYSGWVDEGVSRIGSSCVVSAAEHVATAQASPSPRVSSTGPPHSGFVSGTGQRAPQPSGGSCARMPPISGGGSAWTRSSQDRSGSRASRDYSPKISRRARISSSSCRVTSSSTGPGCRTTLVRMAPRSRSTSLRSASPIPCWPSYRM